MASKEALELIEPAVLVGRGPMMPTYSGRGIHLLDPRAEDIHIEDIAHGLSNICRYGGQSARFISVAQHSVLVTALLETEADHEAQFEALLHDGEEAYGLPDIGTPLKPFFPDLVRCQAAIGRAVFERFGLNWPERPLVKRADRLALATEIRDMVAVQPEECWTVPMPPPSPDVRILRLQPEQAEQLFLWAYEELCLSRRITLDRLVQECPDGFERLPSLEPAF
jgi:hypothetical protein